MQKNRILLVRLSGLASLPRVFSLASSRHALTGFATFVALPWRRHGKALTGFATFVALPWRRHGKARGGRRCGAQPRFFVECPALRKQAFDGGHSTKMPQLALRHLRCVLCTGDSCGIQTHNLLIRSQMLYSVELRSLYVVTRQSQPLPEH